MSIVVEHDKRKVHILKKSLDVFVDEGYEDATYQKIADRCGIQRTTLYLYFKNKQEVFKAVIKEVMDSIEDVFLPVMKNEENSSSDKLKAVISAVMESLDKNRKLLVILVEYLVRIGRAGEDADERVLRRTIRLRRHILHIVQQGVKSGQLKPANPSSLSDVIYGMVEACIFRLSILNRPDIQEERDSILSFIDSLKA